VSGVSTQVSVPEHVAEAVVAMKGTQIIRVEISFFTFEISLIS
jgi:hypothetical protein